MYILYKLIGFFKYLIHFRERLHVKSADFDIYKTIFIQQIQPVIFFWREIPPVQLELIPIAVYFIFYTGRFTH